MTIRRQQVTDWNMMFENHIFGREFKSIIYKELSESTNTHKQHSLCVKVLTRDSSMLYQKTYKNRLSSPFWETRAIGSISGKWEWQPNENLFGSFFSYLVFIQDHNLNSATQLDLEGNDENMEPKELQWEQRFQGIASRWGGGTLLSYKRNSLVGKVP